MGTEQGAGVEAGVTRRGALHLGGAALVAAAGVAANVTQASAQEATPAADVPADFKVVLHAAQEQYWPYVLSNLRNLTTDWPNSRLRVVVDGSAVISLQGENNLTTRLQHLVDAGVELQVCPNALAEHHIDPSTIPNVANTSLGGVVALVQAHNEGFVYVKP
jgi:intracellular sulfur oxidation DsrE/DsrF family protein